MNKRIIVSFLIFCIILLLLATVRSIVHKQRTFELVSSLPKIEIITTDSLILNVSQINTGHPTALIFFNTSCEICLQEIESILSNYDKFASVNFFLVSTESLQTIKFFERDLGVYNFDNIYIGKIIDEHAYKHLNNYIIPHILLYSTNKKLIKEFKGEVKVETIVNVLNKKYD